MIAVAYLSRAVEFVLNAAFTLRGLTSGALLGGLLLAVFARRGGPWPVILGMCASLACLLGVSQFEWMEPVNGKPTAQQVFWPWYTTIGTLVTLGVAWLARRWLHPRAPRP